jgi:hypothetical protein
MSIIIGMAGLSGRIPCALDQVSGAFETFFRSR